MWASVIGAGVAYAYLGASWYGRKAFNELDDVFDRASTKADSYRGRVAAAVASVNQAQTQAADKLIGVLDARKRARASGDDPDEVVAPAGAATTAAVDAAAASDLDGHDSGVHGGSDSESDSVRYDADPAVKRGGMMSRVADATTAWRSRRNSGDLK